MDADLARLAREHHVEPQYVDWRGRPAEVPPETMVAVLAELGADASTPAAIRAELERISAHRALPPFHAHHAGGPGIPVPEGAELQLAGAGEPVLRDGRALPPPDTPPGRYRLHLRAGGREQATELLVVPGRLPEPPPAWGLMTQLYSVRSAGSWGLGDLRDLAELAGWSGSALGAGFVLVNPLHAAEPVPPLAPSPYLPTSRRFVAPYYLRVEDVPEYADLPAADRERVAALAAPLRARNRTLDPLDRDAVWTSQHTALTLLYRVPLSPARQTAYAEYRNREGAALTSFATWCVLAEEHGPDWRSWPVQLHDPGSAAVAAERERLAGRVDFHAWLQWQLDGQLAAAQRAARDAGMPIGIIHDLAVGVHPGGADAWTYQQMFASGMSVGAPPDEFNQRGQDWGQRPWHPHRLAAAGYRPYGDMLASTLRHAGGIRLDHAMQVSRLWWVPEGAPPDQGAYVRYDRAAMLGVLVWEAYRAGALVVGEDLGTVEPEVRADFAASGVLGTSLLWFEREADGRPRPPQEWRESALATVGTHDMPPIAGYLHGDHVDLRDRLGLLTRPVPEERADHRRGLADWLALLAGLGLLAADPAEVAAALDRGEQRYDTELITALHAFLARTPARLIGVSLADAVGERRTQNQPGTTDEYPNWRVPLGDAAGRPVLLDDLPADAGLQAVVDPVRKR
ncbi:4-alpha-glucanotransferase [Actinomadura craniellae]|uniref:4-alpha-glucanotransferase n=1 Tax=Actinomadura craniellae TaxID=2231787 RepID=A0A365GYB5_9ACTN|nr:4-alpha-glucanotransferase [Actinomadura craniellae]RAY11811.1 4-alpha-glucanotransferase [Actinomadura craniellae]